MINCNKSVAVALVVMFKGINITMMQLTTEGHDVMIWVCGMFICASDDCSSVFFVSDIANVKKIENCYY